MVVGKAMMRWPAWDRTPAPKRRFLVRIRLARLEGLSPAIAGGSKVFVALEVGWKGAARGRGIPYLRRRRRGSRSRSGGVSGVAAMGIGGDAVWMAGEENEFEKVCCFSEPNVDAAVAGGGGPLPFCSREISFSVLLGNGAEGKAGKKGKLKEAGSAAVNLGKWAWDFHLKAPAGAFESKESPFHTERKQFPVTLRKDDLIAEATIHVDVSFIDIESQVHGEEICKSRKHKDVLDDNDFLVTDDPCSSSDMDSDLPKSVPIANNEGKDLPSKHRRTSSSINSSSSDRGDSSPEISKHRFLLWGSKSRTKKLAGEKVDKDQPETTKEEEDDPIGKWESREFVSRDRQTKLKTPSFFASIDQRDETADGQSACTALVAVIAEALHSRAASMPTRSEFDALIRKGSSEWRRLCNDKSYTDRFPNKHFDLDTILEAEISSTLVLPEKSFVGFFEPESFESLRGAVSFDDIWNAITKDNTEGAPKFYIVSWNDHFFLLVLESEAFFIVDTLGERLFEGCRKAYVLKFDESAEMRKVPVSEEDEVSDEVIWNGKDCCREFIKRFFAAIPLREELELEGKGQGSSALHQRLQIELHYTEARKPEVRKQEARKPEARKAGDKEVMS